MVPCFIYLPKVIELQGSLVLSKANTFNKLGASIKGQMHKGLYYAYTAMS